MRLSEADSCLTICHPRSLGIGFPMQQQLHGQEEGKLTGGWLAASASALSCWGAAEGVPGSMWLVPCPVQQLPGRPQRTLTEGWLAASAPAVGCCGGPAMQTQGGMGLVARLQQQLQRRKQWGLTAHISPGHPVPAIALVGLQVGRLLRQARAASGSS